ncbi:hypothetical protein BS47DRAFT_1339619, partial [Hydnum rufescens UP504]
MRRFYRSHGITPVSAPVRARFALTALALPHERGDDDEEQENRKAVCEEHLANRRHRRKYIFSAFHLCFYVSHMIFYLYGVLLDSGVSETTRHP